MTEQTTQITEAQAAERKRAEASNFLAIVRGRLPLIFVHAIRFDQVLNAMSNKDLASKFSTSVGKVFDIKKNRNFSYVGVDYKPTNEDVASAEAWISAIGTENAKGLQAAGDQSLLQKVLDQYKERGLASPEEAAALSAARGATRKPRESAATMKAEGTASAEQAQTAAAGSADDLLG